MKLGNIVEGMKIIAAYASPDAYCVQAEHDRVWCGSADLPLSSAEKVRMEELGWFVADDSWSFFT